MGIASFVVLPAMTSANDSSVRVVRLPATLQNLVNLSALLQKLEQGPRAPDPGQYRQLIQRISTELQQQSVDPALPELLACFPSTAQLYENLRYEAAGLCLSPLASSVETEKAARRLLQSLSASRPKAS